MATTWDDVASKLDGTASSPSPGDLPIVLLTWAGTGSDMLNTGWPQPAAVGQAAEAAFPGVFKWQPIGNYPAAVYPMGASVTQGFNEGVRQATQVWPNNLLIPIGYSQGAICASHFWRDWAIANNQQHRIVAGLAWGNPLRSPGFANGNAFANWGMPPLLDGQVTGGIAGSDCLTPDQTPSNWLDFVWLGTDGGATELYTQCPVGSDPWVAEPLVGLDETLIYRMIVTQNFGGTLQGLINLIVAAGEQFFTNPINMVIGLAEAIWNGLRFLGAGGAADHYAYNVQPMIDYLCRVVAPRFA